MRAFARGSQGTREPLRDGHYAPTPAWDDPCCLGRCVGSGLLKSGERWVTSAQVRLDQNLPLQSIHMTPGQSQQGPDFKQLLADYR